MTFLDSPERTLESPFPDPKNRSGVQLFGKHTSSVVRSRVPTFFRMYGQVPNFSFFIDFDAHTSIQNTMGKSTPRLYVPICVPKRCSPLPLLRSSEQAFKQMSPRTSRSECRQVKSFFFLGKKKWSTTLLDLLLGLGCRKRRRCFFS